jgi:hypothetical protein
LDPCTVNGLRVPRSAVGTNEHHGPTSQAKTAPFGNRIDAGMKNVRNNLDSGLTCAQAELGFVFQRTSRRQRLASVPREGLLAAFVHARRLPLGGSMCVAPSPVRRLADWNWDGDVIVHNPIVRSARPVVGRPRPQYDIDVREYLVTEHNALMQRTVREDISTFVKAGPEATKADLLVTKIPKSFDFRAHVAVSFVAEKIAYRPNPARDPWQFPDETLELKAGDCEDRAFLLASLLIAMGVSPYNVRVALGKVRVRTGDTQPSDFDHMWVMYKNEAGRWTLLEPPPQEPTLAIGSKTRCQGATDLLKALPTQSVTVEYRPRFLFNDSHLWEVTGGKEHASFETTLKRRWRKLNPKFVGEVHRTILRVALAGADLRVVQALEGYFTRALLVGPIVDDIDKRHYNPLDHFDNGYITEGWALVDTRLKAFAADNRAQLDQFALAAHGIADFYAHSSYAHFADVVQGTTEEWDYVTLCTASAPTQGIAPEYSAASGFDLTSGQFTVNPTYWDLKKRPGSEIAARWRGALISGRYAQEKDTQPGLISLVTEGPTFIPKELLNRKDAQGLPDFPDRGSFPHHNEIAVDDAARSSRHRLYREVRNSRTDRMSYANQFRWRRNAAIRHIRQVFQASWNVGPINLQPLP